MNRGVGAELVQDLFGQSALEVPRTVCCPWWEDDCLPTVLNFCKIVRTSIIWNVIPWLEFGVPCHAIRVCIDDREMSVLDLKRDSHRFAMLYDVRQDT